MNYEKFLIISCYEEMRKNSFKADELINFLRKIKRDLLWALDENRYPNQHFELSCCLNNLDTLIEVITLKYIK